jgi:hypothetical protein
MVAEILASLLAEVWLLGHVEPRLVLLKLGFVVPKGRVG